MATRVRTMTRVGAADFDRRMKEWGERVVNNTNQATKDLASEIVTNLIRATPKLTGQAAANWQAQVVSPPSEFKAGFTDYKAAEAIALENITRRKSGEPVHIRNNTPYITRLNAGWSAQAPAGFIEQAMSAANTKMRQIKILNNLKRLK